MQSIKTFFKIIYRNKQSFIGMLILVMFILMATVGAAVVPLDLTPNFENRYRRPAIIEMIFGVKEVDETNEEMEIARNPFMQMGEQEEKTEEEEKEGNLYKNKRYIMGTDYIGRDIFAQVVHGSRDVLTIGFLAATFAILIGVTIGALSGFIGGWVDSMLMLITNLFLTIPSFPIMIILSAFISIKSPLVMASILAIFGWAGLARAVRAQILEIKERGFIVVCKVMGLNNFYIIFREVLPNMVSYLAINFITIMQSSIVSSVGVMMLGFAPYTPTNWGVMLNSAIRQGLTNPDAIYYLLSPILCLTLFQLGCIFFASGIDDALNPRLRN
ncbi:ABC transporter permease [Caldicoprobacter faecalis]|uniref:ABC-type dipeptide/oligopeptide/nickel transport system, permease component n=1 Tax=Caldicoprobacter faecalis TaxID=937334 RepID=A0A1I5V2V2_9FIRM|nr:ABC transporter permease [Caldicoprobacter faecalis]SFQ01647.1 ABC-type dipeptide/oligopeptide/nickel transport system, permease component [Caldicoprobacter faecalis]